MSQMSSHGPLRRFSVRGTKGPVTRKETIGLPSGRQGPSSARLLPALQRARRVLNVQRPLAEERGQKLASRSSMVLLSCQSCSAWMIQSVVTLSKEDRAFMSSSRQPTASKRHGAFMTLLASVDRHTVARLTGDDFMNIRWVMRRAQVCSTMTARRRRSATRMWPVGGGGGFWADGGSVLNRGKNHLDWVAPRTLTRLGNLLGGRRNGWCRTCRRPPCAAWRRAVLSPAGPSSLH